METGPGIDDATIERSASQGWGTSLIGFGERPTLLIVDMQNDAKHADAVSLDETLRCVATVGARPAAPAS